MRLARGSLKSCRIAKNLLSWFLGHSSLVKERPRCLYDVLCVCVRVCFSLSLSLALSLSLYIYIYIYTHVHTYALEISAVLDYVCLFAASPTLHPASRLKLAQATVF